MNSYFEIKKYCSLHMPHYNRVFIIFALCKNTCYFVIIHMPILPYIEWKINDEMEVRGALALSDLHDSLRTVIFQLASD